jgi:plastocyanin
VIALALATAALAAPSGTAVGIGLSEWEVAVYRPKVQVGKVRFNITNYGEDGHDFAVRNRWGRIVKRAPELASEARTTLPVRFRTAGRFTLICTLEGHEDAGMKAPFRVVKRPKRR